MKRLIVACALPLVAGCGTLGIGATNNTGQIDYRVAETDPATPQQIAGSTSQNPATKSRLLRRYSGSTDVFNSTATTDDQRDVYSIVLEQLIVGQYIGENYFAQPAEVAVLANAFEFDASPSEGAAARFLESPEIFRAANADSQSQTATDQRLKLIYFSPDVYLGQPLNFSALPIIAPSKYEGRPIGIQLVVLELDKLPGPVKSLLRTVADLGRASNASSAIPGIGDVALELGSSMLSGNASNDDLVFEYRFVLFPAHLSTSQTGTSQRNETATFQPGRYVVRRQELRRRQMSWDDLVLDHNTARLFEKRPGGTDCTSLLAQPAGPVGEDETYCEFREDTYAVINILKHPPGTPEASYAQQTLAEFNEVYQAALDLEGEPINVITENLQLRVEQARSTAWLSDMSNKWTALQQTLQAYDALRYPGAADDPSAALTESAKLSCRAGPAATLATQLLEAELKVESASRDFVQAYQRGIEAPPATSAAGQTQQSAPVAPFKDSEQATIVERLALYAVPKNASLRTNFSTTGAFRSEYVEGKTGNELATALLGAARAVSRQFTCKNLEDRGWFEELPSEAEAGN